MIKMDTAIFRASKFTSNSFIYCCLVFNTIKRACSKKSLMFRGCQNEPSPGRFDGLPTFLMRGFRMIQFLTLFNPSFLVRTRTRLFPPKGKKRDENRRSEREEIFPV